MPKIKYNTQAGFTTIDIVFAIVMPTLIIFAIFTAYTKDSTTEQSPPIVELISRVEPTSSDFWGIGTTDRALDDEADGLDYAERLYYIDSGQVISTDKNITDTTFKIDTARVQAKAEFYALMADKLEDSGFKLTGGVDLKDALLSPEKEFAALYTQANANRMCLVYNPTTANESRFTCANVNLQATQSERSRELINTLSSYTIKDKTYVHKSYSSTYYGSEPQENSGYEYAIGELYDYRLVSGVPIVNESGDVSVVFWRLGSSAWNLFIDESVIGSNLRQACAEIDQTTAPALPNFVCTDDNGEYKLLGDYYGQ